MRHTQLKEKTISPFFANVTTKKFRPIFYFGDLFSLLSATANLCIICKICTLRETVGQIDREKEGRSLHKIGKNITVRNCTYYTPRGNISDYSKRSYWCFMKHTQFEKKNRLLPLQRNSGLPSATVGLLSLFLATANLDIILKTFALTYQSINKSKYKTHPTYIVIIQRFQKWSNVMQISLWK